MKLRTKCEGNWCNASNTYGLDASIFCSVWDCLTKCFKVSEFLFTSITRNLSYRWETRATSCLRDICLPTIYGDLETGVGVTQGHHSIAWVWFHILFLTIFVMYVTHTLSLLSQYAFCDGYFMYLFCNYFRSFMILLSPSLFSSFSNIHWFLTYIFDFYSRIPHRFRDTPTYWSKIAKFSHPLVYSAPPLGVKPSELSNNRRWRKTRMMNLSGGKRISTKL